MDFFSTFSPTPVFFRLKSSKEGIFIFSFFVIAQYLNIAIRLIFLFIF